MATAEEHRAGRDRDWTDGEREGVPPIDDQPTGIDAESAVEGSTPPADRPLAVSDRVTPLEESRPELLAARAARERPDLPQAPPDDPGGRLATGAQAESDGATDPEWSPDDAGLSAEEAALHVEER